MVELLSTFDGARQTMSPLSWLRDPARPDLRVSSALDRVRRAPTILHAMRTTPALLRVVDAAVHDGVENPSMLTPMLEAIDDERDTVTGLVAVHALARVPGPDAEARLTELAFDAIAGFEEHALWALACRDMTPGLIWPLTRAVARGGLSGMHAQRALAGRAGRLTDSVLFALASELREATSDDARRYLVETIGLIPGRLAQATLERVANDGSKAASVRMVAISAFIERIDERLPSSIAALVRRTDELGASARTVQAQRRLLRRGPFRDPRREPGLRVAQVHLTAPLDDQAAAAGTGDTGGVAALLTQLGPALASQDRVAEVVSIGRTHPGETRASTHSRRGLRGERVALPPGEGVSFSGRWPAIIAAERGVRAALLAGPLPDVMHLRVADPGSEAAARVAQELGIPTVFTLAPDPHGPIASAESSGELDRRSFSAEDARGALWYRTLLVDRLARGARELVLFPRPDPRAELEHLTGVDIAAGPPNHTVVAEGIDPDRAQRAAADARAADPAPSVIADLESAVAALPDGRHGLPLLVSVGRLHATKGMARLVEAFAIDPDLAARANLVIVGGDLGDPSAAETAELNRFRMSFDRHPGLAERVVLLGHRPPDDVSLVLAAAQAGWGRLIGAGGAYACASIKEEFGLAIIEAMAAGLPVVTPDGGGPATYVEAGVTGSLVDTSDPAAIAQGARAVLELSRDPATAGRTREMVESRFTLERMARTLTAVYRVTAGASTLGHAVNTVTQDEDPVEEVAA